MIDLHFHLLPGIDDGAPDLATAVRMCRLAAADGCEQIVATPHQRHAAWDNTDPEGLERLLAEVRAVVGERPLLHLGAEIRIGPGLLDELDRHPDSGLTPLAGSRYLLLEFARHRNEVDAEELVHELVVGGWRPILAHPEFIPFLAEDLELMHRLADAGGLFQLTAGSLTGDFGVRVRRRAREMLLEELVHFVASDAHGDGWRPPGLGRAVAEISHLRGEEVARALTRDHPRAVLEDRDEVSSGALGRLAAGRRA